MCDDITCDDLHLASVAGMDDITCDDLTYDDLNPECEIMVLGLRYVERELIQEILSKIQYYGYRYGLVTSVLGI